MLVYMKKDDAIRKRLHDIIENADSTMLRALEDIIAEGSGEGISPWWDDRAFVNEMKQRWKDYEEGKGKVYSHEEVMERLEKRLKKAKRG